MIRISTWKRKVSRIIRKEDEGLIITQKSILNGDSYYELGIRQRLEFLVY